MKQTVAPTMALSAAKIESFVDDYRKEIFAARLQETETGFYVSTYAAVDYAAEDLESLGYIVDDTAYSYLVTVVSNMILDMDN